MSKIMVMAAALLSLSALTACGERYQSEYYTGQSAQRVSRVEFAKVIAVRPVTIRNEENKYGSLAGLAAGAVGGSAIGGGWRANALGALGGAVAGGLLGSAVDDQINTVNAFEYIVETDNGQSMALAQADQQPFAVGDKVRLIMGPPARLIRG